LAVSKADFPELKSKAKELIHFRFGLSPKESKWIEIVEQIAAFQKRDRVISDLGDQELNFDQGKGNFNLKI